MLVPMPTPRGFHAAAVVGGVMYVAGGKDADRKTLDSMLRYYPHPKNPKWVECAPLKTPRYVLGLAAVDHRLYAIGGSGPDSKHLTSVEKYDARCDNWSVVPGMDYRGPAPPGHEQQPYVVGACVRLAE